MSSISGALAGEYGYWQIPGEPGSWKNRVAITYSNAGGATKGLQVPITLDNTFDYTACLTGGVDIRVTDVDGVTILPYYIESWNSGTSASIWFKVDLANTSNHTAYLYYGNSLGTPIAPAATNTAPVGPFTHSDTFITPSGGNGPKIVPENMLLDGGVYYAVVEDRNTTNSVGMMYTTNPTVTTGWTWDGTKVAASSMSPHLCKVGSTYYILYWNNSTNSIYIASCSTVNGTYTVLGELLPIGGVGAWDHGTVFEPSLVENYDGNGNFGLLYTGSSSTPVVGDERTGFATSTTFPNLGGWTKQGIAPILPLGAAGTVYHTDTADPSATLFNGVWYIQYCSTSSSAVSGIPASISYATTTDWVTFTEINKAHFSPGASTRWDCEGVWRGHVPIYQIGGIWVQLYCGTAVADASTIHGGVMTAPATAVQDIRNNADAVFDFWDGFNGVSINSNKWSVGTTFNATVSGSILDLNAALTSGAFVMPMTGSTGFGTKVVLECFAKFKTARSDSTQVLGVFLGGADISSTSTLNSLRVVSYSNAAFQQMTQTPGGFPLVAISGATLETASYHKVQIFWDGTTVTYSFDGHTSTATPAITYSGFQPSIYVQDISSVPELLVDWIRIRQWPSNESVVSFGAEQSRTGQSITG